MNDNMFEIKELQDQVKKLPWTIHPNRRGLKRRNVTKMLHKKKASKLARRRNR